MANEILYAELSSASQTVLAITGCNQSNRGSSPHRQRTPSQSYCFGTSSSAGSFRLRFFGSSYCLWKKYSTIALYHRFFLLSRLFLKKIKKDKKTMILLVKNSPHTEAVFCLIRYRITLPDHSLHTFGAFLPSDQAFLPHLLPTNPNLPIFVW